MLSAIDNWRKKQRLRSRPEAVRLLLAEAIAGQMREVESDRDAAVESSKWKYGGDDAGDR
jgi:hypothetical protein